MSSSGHIDDKNKDILILGKGSTQGLNDTALTVEAKYPINFTQSGKRFVIGKLNILLILHNQEKDLY